ncbi:conserved Plasmodium protein, unknown function [Plasmodium malariae]|uniref:Uncharacterized protein n=1 Tax=Plasmodium malariae TaxID=5858 RepID=A0A1A8XAC5_PLAMA|nr:conserved Plasmodium protein, unknown function [Plasmodium malariae]SBT00775.1 hypothetical protein, conserved [Plasmodium malariae]SCN12872.1 conserved Plasmodium protein, unknown function [Plasmodium malariae]
MKAVRILTAIVSILLGGKIISGSLKVNMDNKTYTLLYNNKRVNFNEIDPLRIMFHSNQVKHCGNSIIDFLNIISSYDLSKMSFVVKHIDITYDKPLVYDQMYKIIGAVTYYGNTSLKISLIGTSIENKKNSTGIFGIKNLLGVTGSDIEELKKNENKLEEIFKKYKESNKGIIDINDKELHDMEKQKQCKNYFLAHYTIVHIDKYGFKKTIKDEYKKDYPVMALEKLKELATTFC